MLFNKKMACAINRASDPIGLKTFFWLIFQEKRKKKK